MVLSLGGYEGVADLPLYSTVLTLFDVEAMTIVSSLGAYKDSPDRDALPFSISAVHFQARTQQQTHFKRPFPRPRNNLQPPPSSTRTIQK